MEEIERALETLCGRKNINRSIYDKKIRKEYLLLEQYKDDSTLIKEILKNYPRPTTLEVGTVGAYLWGGEQKYFGNIHPVCSAIYSNSFSIPSSSQQQDDKHNSTCIHQIWVYDKYLNKLVKHQDSLSSKAYVFSFAFPSSFSFDFSKEKEEYKYGLKEKDLEILKKEGITHVSIIDTKNSKHVIAVPMSPISDIYVFPDFSSSFSSSSEDSSFSYLFFFLFILILFIFLIWYYMRNKE